MSQEILHHHENNEQHKDRDLWIAGAIILGVVFIPTVLAALVHLLSR